MAAGNRMETYAARLASFSVAHPLKKRGSDTKGTKTLKWPLKSPSTDELATAGLFYRPTASNPDNTICFLCDKNIDGWEEDDNAVTEHLKLSPECGWAINVYIEQQLGNGSYDIGNPWDKKLSDARKMTFGSKWPHENKRGWKCKTQKMIEAGWYYCPTAESDDYAKCSYCGLGLDGWEPKDDPHDEHQRRSPECAFFAFPDSSKSKSGRPRSRASKASRVSTQSNFTTVSDVTSIGEAETHETESISLAPEEVERPIKAARGAKKGGKSKKAPTKSKVKAAAMKAEESTLASSFIEPEDDDFEVKVEKSSTRAGRNKKRGSDEINGENDKPPSENDVTEATEGQPPAKRRATRASSVTEVTCEPSSILQNGLQMDTSMTDAEIMPPPAAPPSKKGGKEGRKKLSSSLRTASGASIASVASLRSAVPDDDDIDAALEADLNRPLTDDEIDIEQPETQRPKTRRLTRTRPASKNGAASTAQVRRTTRASTISNGDLNSEDRDVSMQDVVGVPTENVQDDLVSNAKDELITPMSTEGTTKGNKSRKASSKKQTVATKSADYEAQSLVVALRVQPDLAPTKPKGPRSRQPSRQVPGRNARPMVPPALEDVAIVDSNVNSVVNVHAGEDEWGRVSDASSSSHAPERQGGKNGLTGAKKEMSGKKAKRVGRTSEDTVQSTIEDAKPNQKENRSSFNAIVVANSPEAELLQAQSANKALDSEIEEASVVPSIGAQPMLEASSPASEDREIVNGIGMRSPSQSVSTTENGQGLQNSAEPTKVTTESTTPLAEASNETSRQLPSAQSTPRPEFSPQSSDAENHPPSSRPSATRPPLTLKSQSHTQMVQIRSAVCTPTASPSKQKPSRLQSAAPWIPAEIEKLFLYSPAGNEENDSFAVDAVITQSVNASLTVPEKKLSMEEWIYHKARQAEEKLRNDCERLVGRFEGEGVRALRTLEGIQCID